MEMMTDLMKGLQLSQAEKKKVRIGGGGEVKGKTGADPQKAFGKLLSDRSVRAEVIEQALGWIWCPVRGTDCKELGDNFFLLTFGQAAGKRKALDEGPWMVSNELLVVAEFDGSKTLDEIVFAFIPIWVRVSNLPLGSMNAITARAIGDEMGEFMETEADSEPNEIIAGRFLRVKVRLDIRKPLMRGVTISLGEDVDDRWCPLSYEFLPEFCYCCGIIGHMDRVCPMNAGKKAVKAFGRELRYIPPKRRLGFDGGRAGDGRGAVVGGGGRSGSGSGGAWSGSRNSGGKMRSDAPSWRKSPEKIRGGEQEKAEKEEEEVHRPSRSLGKEIMPTDIAVQSEGGKVEEARKGEAGNVNSAMQLVDVAKELNVVVSDKPEEKIDLEKGRGKFKKIRREVATSQKGSGDTEKEEKAADRKRSREEDDGMDVDELGRDGKVSRVAASVVGGDAKKAGPADRSCENQ